MSLAPDEFATPAAPAAGPPRAGGRWLTFAQEIKVSHTVFAMPFALLAAYLAAAHEQTMLHRRWPILVLVVVCMVLARTVAMTVNRLADRHYDAANPRTAGRALPTGRLQVRDMAIVAVLCVVAFVVATTGFWLLDRNPWPTLLSPLALAWLVGYSYTKRFTALCHLVLGGALAISPLAAAIAVNPSSLQQPGIWLLSVMVLCWVAGFDVLYALQDFDFDRRTGLRSVPAALGVHGAVWVSRGLHLLCFVALLAAQRLEPLLGAGFIFGIGVVAVLLVIEHALVLKPTARRINMAFATVNGVISVLLGALGILDVMRLTVLP